MPEKPVESGKKQPLWHRLYFDAAYVEFARFIGYAGKPLSEAQQFLLKHEEQFGRAKTIEVGEAITKAEGKADKQTVYLTAEARRLAWQLLGRPPEAPPLVSAREVVGDPQSAPEPEKPKKVRKPPAKPPSEVAGSTARTPLLQQYRDAKEQHPDMLLLFRVGDFYEVYDSDAEQAAKTLGLTLSTRDWSVPMAGFPHHALESYLHKLLKAGHRVAICEQMDAADGTKTKNSDTLRKVTRVVTPGTA